MISSLKEKLDELPGNQKLLLLGGGGAVLVVLILLWAFKGSRAPADTATTEGSKFICQNPSCKNEFRMTVAESREYLAAHPGEPLKCPKCGESNVLPEGAEVSRRRMATDGAKPH